MESLYLFDDYRAALRGLILEKKHKFGKSHSFAALAKAVRIQRTHLSSMLNGRNHFNADQLYAACDFLELGADESHFISLLQQVETSTLKKRRSTLLIEIERIRSEKLDAAKFVGTAAQLPDSSTVLPEFYLNIDAQLVHMFLTVSSYRQDLGKVRTALGLTNSALGRCLQILEKEGLILINGSDISVLKDNFHLSKDTPIYSYYRLLMRQKSLQKLQCDVEDEQFAFSVIFSADDKTKIEVRHRFLKFIESCKDLTAKSKLTNVYQINFDLLDWTR